jgi:hypothetical protein
VGAGRVQEEVMKKGATPVAWGKSGVVGVGERQGQCESTGKIDNFVHFSACIWFSHMDDVICSSFLILRFCEVI